MSNAPQPLIVGNWSLQQQTYEQYVDGVPDPVITSSASHADNAYAQFDKNGTYISATQLTIATATTPLVSRDTLSGTYTYSPTGNITLSAGLVSALHPLVASYPGIPGPSDYIEAVSNSVKITQLTSKLLTLHFEVVINFHHGATSTNYKTVSDLQYTR